MPPPIWLPEQQPETSVGMTDCNIECCPDPSSHQSGQLFYIFLHPNRAQNRWLLVIGAILHANTF